MIFSREEKIAAIHLLMQVAECDGPRCYEENHCLSTTTGKMGVTTQDLLGGITSEAVRLTPNEAFSIMNKASSDKKALFEDCLIEMMQVDGTPKPEELKTWSLIEEALQLPKWKILKPYYNI